MSSLIIEYKFLKNKKICIKNIISDGMSSLIMKCYNRVCDDNLNMSSQKLDCHVSENKFWTTYLWRLLLQIQLRLHMSSQITLLHPIICNDVLATTCRHKRFFSDDFWIFVVVFAFSTHLQAFILERLVLYIYISLII